MARCVFFDDEGRSIGRGCDKGSTCKYVHPGSWAWAKALPAQSDFAKDIRARALKDTRRKAAPSSSAPSSSAAPPVRPAPEPTSEPRSGLSRCVFFDEDGKPVGRGCDKGSTCRYLHPSSPAWARAPIDVSDFANKLRARAAAQKAAFDGPKDMGWAGRAEEKKGARPQPGASASSAAPPTRRASEAAGEPGPSNTFTFGMPLTPAPAGGGGLRRPAPGGAGPLKSSSAKLGGWFEPGEQPTVAKAPAFVPATHTAMPASAPAPTPTPAGSSLLTRTLDPRTSGAKAKQDVSRSTDTSVKPAAPEQQALADPPLAPAIPAPQEPPTLQGSSAPQEAAAIEEDPTANQPKSLADIQTDSKSFIKQLLDAVFKTQELVRAERTQEKTKRLAYSTRYERASKDTRATLETLRAAVEDDRVAAQERLDSRVTRLASLPSVDERLANISTALAGANAQFDAYLGNVEQWRVGFDPRAEKAYAEYEERVQKAEEALENDDRPDWLKKMPQLTTQYEQLVQLEQAANNLKLEQDGRYDEPAASLAHELVEHLKEEDELGKLRTAVEDGRQYAADMRTMQLVDDLRLQDVELRQQLVELDGAVDVVVKAAQNEEEPEESHADYMARMRNKISRRHEQHTERASTIRAQHAQLGELMAEPNPAPAPYDTSELAALIESRIQEDVDDGFLSVAQRLGAYRKTVLNLTSNTAEYAREAAEVIRLVSHYVDGNAQLQDAVADMLAKQLTLTLAAS